MRAYARDETPHFNRLGTAHALQAGRQSPGTWHVFARGVDDQALSGRVV